MFSLMYQLKAVMVGIAQYKKINIDDVWQVFKKSIFTGSLIHLRDVEIVFGKGSVRLLAAMGSSTKKQFNEYFVSKLLLGYFQDEDENRRVKAIGVIRELLNQREEVRYLNMKNS